MAQRTETGTPPVGRLDPGLRKLAAVIVAGSVTAMLDMTMATVALADLTRAFGASVTTVQWVSTAYLLAIAMVIPTTGRLVERFGARALWMFALSAFLIGSALCGAAWPVGSLIAFRAVQGIGGGMIVPLSMMVLTQAGGQQSAPQRASHFPGGAVATARLGPAPHAPSARFRGGAALAHNDSACPAEALLRGPKGLPRPWQEYAGRLMPW
ncbi:MFS transporter [Streptomyces celluloflavus]|uniref:MFS transporter n=1 Tax=Streptomyces celluloflavus TaxID=58344 RepID=A0ABW7RLJ4_9ACTN